MVVNFPRRKGQIQQQPVPHTIESNRVVDHYFSTARTQAFVVGAKELEKLWEILESFGDVEASVEYSNGRKLVYRNCKELTADENPKTRRAIQLVMTSKADYKERAITIRFLDQRSKNALVSIEKGDENDLVTQNKLSDIIEGTKPWYSFLARQKLPFVLCYVYFAALGIDTWYRWPKVVKLADMPWEPISFATLGFILAVVLTVVVMEGLDTLWRLLFPMGEYAWGQGEKRQKTRAKFHWAVLIPGVLTALGSLMFRVMGWL